MNLQEENKEHKTKQRIFSMFVFLLFLPLLQLVFPFLKENALNGIDSAPPLPNYTISTWCNEEYQKLYLPAFEQNIGFHNSFVRLHNQINYSIFGSSDLADVVIGKNGYLFLKSDVNAVTGKNFIGNEYIQIQTQKIKLIQQELKKKNVDFFVVLAPGKGSFFSEYIPDKIKTTTIPDSTNYVCYKNAFNIHDVNSLDLRATFLAIKNVEKYPLYSPTGVHWSEYGCYIAGLEIVNYIEKLRKINLPDIKLQSIDVVSLSGKHSTDYDAASLMNVFTTIPHPDYAIPKLRFDSDSSTQRPRFVCIADSCFAGMVSTKIPSTVFTDYKFWLYNDIIFPESSLKEKKVKDINLKKELEKQDVICILATDASLSVFPFGFVDTVYEIYAKKDANYYSLKNKEFHYYVTNTIKNIKNNRAWKKQLAEKAKSKGRPEMDEFIDNAVWLYEQEHAFHFFLIKTISNINKDEKWKALLIENAKKKRISLMDEAIENAVWLYEQEQLKIKSE